MKIQIFGIGCPTCHKLEADVLEVIREQGLEAQVERVDDLERILHQGLTALPGLMINGRLAACGYCGKRRITQLIQEAVISETT